MASRNFVDRDGNAWDVIPRSKTEWEFEPIGGNKEARKVVDPPGYERDPFELSNEELQRLLDSAREPRTRPRKSPFLD